MKTDLQSWRDSPKGTYDQLIHELMVWPTWTRPRVGPFGDIGLLRHYTPIQLRDGGEWDFIYQHRRSWAFPFF